MDTLIKKLLPLLLIGSGTLKATLFFPMDTMQLHTAILSSTHQNRILVEEGRIHKVIYPDSGSFSISIEEESGQVFVHCLEPYPSPVTMSIVTSDGQVQDIEASFEDKASEVLVLQEMAPEQPCVEESFCSNDACRYMCASPEEIQEKVNTIIHGKVPCGYSSCTPKRFVRKIKKCLKGERIGRLAGPGEDLDIWRIVNTSPCQTAKVRECELGFEGSTWIYLEKNGLNPGESTIAIVSVERFDG